MIYFLGWELGSIFSHGSVVSQGSDVFPESIIFQGAVVFPRAGVSFFPGVGVIFFSQGSGSFFPRAQLFPRAGPFAPLRPQAPAVTPGRAGGGDAEGTALHHRDGAGSCQILEDPGGIKAAATK